MWKNVRSIFSLNDPGWGRSGGGGQRPPQRPDNDGPPDLDDLWRDFNRRLNGLFRKGGGGSPPSGGGGEGPSMKGAGTGLGILGGVAALLWLGSGFYIVPEGHVSAVLRFGELTQVVERAGFTWRMPYPIEAHEIVPAQRLNTTEIGYRNGVRNKTLRESLMLTQDQSIVDIQFAVQWRIGDAQAFLFNNRFGTVRDDVVRAAEESVRAAAESAVREVVGRKGIDQVLYEEKELVAKESRDRIQAILDRYSSGVAIVDVTIQQAQPPDQVQEAFDDANKAAQDRERLINEGQAYANDVIPKARGTAARLLEESDGYRQRIVATAEGDASRFQQVYAEYAKAPKVTRDRMYLETMQQVFSNTSKVYVDSKSGSNLLYLPLDRLIQQASADAQRSASAAAGQQPATAAPAAPAEAPAAARTEGLRGRERDTR